MGEPWTWRSPLAHLGLVARAAADAAKPADSTGVALAEQPFRAMVTLRGNADDPAFVDAVAGATGIAPPILPNTVAGADTVAHGPRLLWMGPYEWLLVAEPESGFDMAATLAEMLATPAAVAVDVSDSRAVIVLAGTAARDVLAKGCPLDLHARTFNPGRCAQSLLASIPVLLHQTADTPVFEIYVARSLADALWRWLEDAAEEYGVRIIPPGTA